MHAIVAGRRAEIAVLCEQYGVARLDVFGSATSDAFDEATSDVDFLVEFDDPNGPSFDDYFSFKDGLEALLGRPVDLVTLRSIRNPYFLRRVEATRQPLYAS